MDPFEILKIYVNISLHVSQFVDFQQNEKSNEVLFSAPITQPPFHNFEYILCQNMRSNTIVWNKNDEVGSLCILALSEQTHFIPEYKNTDLMHQLISLNTENRTLQDLDSLVHRLTRHLSCLQESHLPIGEARTEML